MPRIRSLKPDFFSSEQVVSVSFAARYLFEGIWVFGDDDGFIADAPLQLKMKIFPADSVDVAALIEELVGVGLVERVETDQGPALNVPSFRNHQAPKYPTPTKFTRDGVTLTERSPSAGEVLPKDSGSVHPGEEIEEIEGGGERDVTEESVTTPHCPRHPNGTDKPCMDCKRARLEAEAANKARKPPPPRHRHVWAVDGVCECGARREAS